MGLFSKKPKECLICPFCFSIRLGQREIDRSTDAAISGFLALGTPGLIFGGTDKFNEIYYVCFDCGSEFDPQEALVGTPEAAESLRNGNDGGSVEYTVTVEDDGTWEDVGSQKSSDTEMSGLSDEEQIRMLDYKKKLIKERIAQKRGGSSKYSPSAENRLEDVDLDGIVEKYLDRPGNGIRALMQARNWDFDYAKSYFDEYADELKNKSKEVIVKQSNILPPTPSKASREKYNKQLDALVRENLDNPIAGIKAIRVSTDWGLKRAKAYYEVRARDFRKEISKEKSKGRAPGRKTGAVDMGTPLKDLAMQNAKRIGMGSTMLFTTSMMVIILGYNEYAGSFFTFLVISWVLGLFIWVPLYLVLRSFNRFLQNGLLVDYGRNVVKVCAVLALGILVLRDSNPESATDTAKNNVEGERAPASSEADNIIEVDE